MDLVLWIPLGVLIAGLLIAGWRHADRIDGAAGHHTFPRTRNRNRNPTRAPAAAPRPPVVDAPVPPEDDLLIGPPMVEMPSTSETTSTDVPLRDWLRHLHLENRNVWADVVTEFHDAFMADPALADYFRDSDRAALQKHFLAVVIAVTGDGVSVEALQRLQARHADVRNSRGEPISRPIFDAAAGVLTAILAEKGVPARTLCQVNLILARVQQVIVAPA